MRVVVQRVLEAEVVVDGVSVGRIGRGLALLVGLVIGDGEEQVVWMARKIAGLRIFDDATVAEAGGSVLAVSQFTVVADCRKGRRPSFDRAMPSPAASPLFEHFVGELAADVGQVATGRFGAVMQLHLVNDGPFTLVLDSPAPSGAAIRPPPKPKL